jgi:hypothetical protein
MHTRNAPRNDIGCPKQRQSLQPKTRCLYFAMTELPRLEHLIGLTNMAGDNRNRIFQRYPPNRRDNQLPDKIQRLSLLSTL